MENSELHRPSLAAILSALDATRTQVHLLNAAIAGLAMHADPVAGETAARLVEKAAQEPPTPLVLGEAVEREHREGARVLALYLAALLRGDQKSQLGAEEPSAEP